MNPPKVAHILPPFPANSILIFTANILDFHTKKDEFFSELSLQEKKQALSFITQNLQEKYITSHGILRKLLAFYSNKSTSDISYTLQKYGKPELINSNGLQFNMSHSGDFAAYIIARNQTVGIDIEWKNMKLNFQEFFDQFLSPREIHFFHNNSHFNSAEKSDFFYRLWTQKEALVKAIGMGLSYPMTTIDVLNLQKRDQAHQIIHGQKFYYAQLYDVENYACSFCYSNSLDASFSISSSFRLSSSCF